MSLIPDQAVASPFVRLQCGLRLMEREARAATAAEVAGHQDKGETIARFYSKLDQQEAARRVWRRCVGAPTGAPRNAAEIGPRRRHRLREPAWQLSKPTVQPAVAKLPGSDPVAGATCTSPS
jgi:hypothetical protein